MHEKEKPIQDLEKELKKQLEEFRGLPAQAEKTDSVLDQRMFLNVELLIKEIKEISLVSVTAAPFSLTILQSGAKVNILLLILSFIVFLLNVLILNIIVWYHNNEFSKSTKSQKLETVTMTAAAKVVSDNFQKSERRIEELLKYLNSQTNLNNNRTLEAYKQFPILYKINKFGIIFFSLAVLLLILSIVQPLLLEWVKF